MIFIVLHEYDIIRIFFFSPLKARRIFLNISWKETMVTFPSKKGIKIPPSQIAP